MDSPTTQHTLTHMNPFEKLAHDFTILQQQLSLVSQQLEQTETSNQSAISYISSLETKIVNIGDSNCELKTKLREKTLLLEKYIEKYGYENVRGGRYTNSKTLKDNTSDKKTYASEVTCYKCGKQGHYANKCNSKKLKKNTLSF